MIPQDEVKSNLKIALIRVRDESAWISCRSIMDNLCESYSRIAETPSFYVYSGESSFKVIEDIISQDVDVISFVDHRVRLGELFSSRKFLNHIKEKKIKILIHTFGCFVDRLSEYYEAGQLLLGEDVTFIGASGRQVNLVNKVMKAPNARFVPFPVDTESFKFDPEKRNELRKKLNVDDSTRLFLYTGRISALKNVELSMKFLSGREKLTFLYVGNFDSYEPLIGQPYLGEMEQINARVKAQVDPHNKWCHHLSFIPHHEMKNYLSAADAYISLATFRGEDFGMSVAEAKSTGLAAFLTDWGGLSGFKSLPQTFSARVSLETQDIKIDLSSMDSQIENFTNTYDREAVARETRNVFSIDAVAKKLKALLKQNERYPGLNPKYVFRRNAITSSGFGIISELKDLYEEYSR